jgi:ABC-type sulfate transport system permease subunit
MRTASSARSRWSLRTLGLGYLALLLLAPLLLIFFRTFEP